MLRLTRIGVAVLGLLAGAAGAAELDLSGERPPEPAADAGPCASRLGGARLVEGGSLRALLVAAPPPLPPPPPQPFEDAHAGRLDCTGTAEPDAPLAVAQAGSSRLVLDVPDALDAGCWEVAIARGCARRRIPLHVLRPEREPDRFVAWFDLGPVRSRNAARREESAGLRVLEVAPLSSLGGTLVRLALEPDADPALADEALARLSAQPELRQRAAVYRGNPGAEPGWGARRIGADRLRTSRRGKAVTLALIDTGAPAERVRQSRDFTGREPAVGVHGAALAGIAAAGDEPAAPAASLVSLAACRAEPGGTAARCWSSALVRALDAALAARARIALLGWNGPEDALVARALERAARRGLLLVAPVGDAGDERSPAFPASHPDVLGVTAIDVEGGAFRLAARGEHVQLAAPGVDVRVALPGSDEPVALSGSALAAAHVAGAAARLLELAPRVTSRALRETLVATAADLGEPGRDPVFGAGQVDVCSAARALLSKKTETQEDPCSAQP
jgi:subtilisin family serine protease